MSTTKSPVNPMFVSYDIAEHQAAIEVMTSPRQMCLYYLIFHATVAGKHIPLNYVHAAKIVGVHHQYYRAALKELRMNGLVDEDEDLGVVLRGAVEARRRSVEAMLRGRGSNVVPLPRKQQ